MGAEYYKRSGGDAMAAATSLPERIARLEENLNHLSSKVDVIEEKGDQSATDVLLIKKDIKSMCKDMGDLKADVFTVVAEQTNKTWDLINKGGKLLFALIAIIVIMAGVKLLPEILQMLV